MAVFRLCPISISRDTGYLPHFSVNERFTVLRNETARVYSIGQPDCATAL
jgi:hypothetical protein